MSAGAAEDLQITAAVIDCWRINYGLDTRSPADAARYWSDTCAGMAPAGAVAALGLALAEIERLRNTGTAGRPFTARDVGD